jgi:hypothetical protein
MNSQPFPSLCSADILVCGVDIPVDLKPTPSTISTTTQPPL